MRRWIWLAQETLRGALFSSMVSLRNVKPYICNRCKKLSTYLTYQVRYPRSQKTSILLSVSYWETEFSSLSSLIVPKGVDTNIVHLQDRSASDMFGYWYFKRTVLSDLSTSVSVLRGKSSESNFIAFIENFRFLSNFKAGYDIYIGRTWFVSSPNSSDRSIQLYVW